MERSAVGKRLTVAQKRIYLGCFVAYAGAYIGRLNLSAALPGILSSLRLSGEQGGALQTIFALTYAAGQLINGAIVDKISARRFMIIGLIGSALANMAFGLSTAYWMLAVAWCLNGVAQSMLWTPIVKLMARWFDGGQQKRVSFTLSMTIILGHLIAWAVAGYMAQLVDWRFSFLIPAAAVGLVSLAVLALIRDEPEDSKPVEKDEGRRHASAQMPLGRMIFGTGLWAMLLCCAGNGFVRDGVITWGPTIIGSVGKGGISSIGLSLVIPAINLAGLLFGKHCYQWFGGNTRFAAGAMTAIGALLSIMVWMFGMQSVVACALLLGVLCAVMYGINPLITTLFPMEYNKVGRVGLVAGLADCFIYLGSSLAGIATGALSDARGWGYVFLIWAAVSVVASAFGMVSMKLWKSKSYN